MATVPLDSASSQLTWSNVVYVGGAVLTLIAAMHVLYEKRAIATGKRKRDYFLSEALVIIAAAVSLFGTIGAIHFGNVVSKLKDADLTQYKKTADLRIAELNKEAATANEKAQEAQDRAAQTFKANTELQVQVKKNAIKADKAETELAKQNKETFNFAHALAKQQATMAEQAHVSPVLTPEQVKILADSLRPFTGQDVIFHSTLDTTVLRLKQSIAQSLMGAGITFKENSMDVGSLYQGVSVVVHSPTDVPPLATALVTGLRQTGVVVNTVSLETVPEHRVALYLGPN